MVLSTNQKLECWKSACSSRTGLVCKDHWLRISVMFFSKQNTSKVMAAVFWVLECMVECMVYTKGTRVIVCGDIFDREEQHQMSTTPNVINTKVQQHQRSTTPKVTTPNANNTKCQQHTNTQIHSYQIHTTALTHTYTHTHIHTYTHTHIHTYSHTRIHRQSHTNSYTHTHIHTNA